MTSTKIAITLDPELLKQTDELVKLGVFSSRSQAISVALSEKLKKCRLERLAVESAKLRDLEEPWLEEEVKEWLEEY
jgi:metal-responsive CopG/Arc/MetJ family transcriptional regulator